MDLKKSIISSFNDSFELKEESLKSLLPVILEAGKLLADAIRK